MSLHQLRSVTIGVPDPGPVADYYTEFGLSRDDDRNLSTVDGGRQLTIEPSATRRLVELTVAVDDAGDLDSVRATLAAAGYEPTTGDDCVSSVEPVTGVRVVLTIAPRLEQAATARDPVNGPGRIERSARRADAVLRTGRVRPRRLGHAVITTTDVAATSRYFTDLIGFKVSDYIGSVGTFLRCSTDHHNLLVLQAPSVYLHHTAWQVDDVDDVGRGAMAMLAEHPERHVWGLGRHHAGANFFWYLRDPAGNFSEYYADLDVIPEDAEWMPEVHEGPLGIYNWGPPPPASFLQPEDQIPLVDAANRADA
jgi:catechol 2,3-dioxygenase-like lactoylglutathione lyase family enzyme